MVMYDVAPDHGAFQKHTSHPDIGIIMIEMKFKKVLSVASTYILNLEYESCVRIDSPRIVTADF